MTIMHTLSGFGHSDCDSDCEDEENEEEESNEEEEEEEEEEEKKSNKRRGHHCDCKEKRCKHN